MSRPVWKWASSARVSSICSSCRSKIIDSRPFSSTAAQNSDAKNAFDELFASDARDNTLSSSRQAKSDQMPVSSWPRPNKSSNNPLNLAGSLSANISPNTPSLSELYADETKHRGIIPTSSETMHHLHVFATKHNTHITLTKPNRDSLISLSVGQLGIRKSHRGTFDAAYQLAVWSMKQILQKGHDRKWYHELRRIELVLRGFGPGREAITKVLLGSEGRDIRNKIVRVTDATRLKFGGTRSKAQRRLG